MDDALRDCGIAKRRSESGRGLEKYRWVDERVRCLSHCFRSLRIRFEHFAEIRSAFFKFVRYFSVETAAN
ncbi:hypothetical protein [Burkholderia territorii]|uniref:hypothetical protein n=1 Tax=Burkholderia territorii TaxID=1503055 RepID=UPI0039BF4736